MSPRNINTEEPGPPRELVDRAAEDCTDPLEAAVFLESTGITDGVARDRFDAPNVFALASSAFAARSGAAAPGPEPGARRPTESGSVAAARIALRGVLYAIPAVVALSLLPAADPTESTLLLGGLALSWAAGYGTTYVAWAYLGNLDAPAARRWLRRAILVGTVVAALGAAVAVYGALMLTATLNVTLWTALLLVGQATYLLSASALLMTGHEVLLTVALAPAVTGAVLSMLDGPAVPTAAGALRAATAGRELLWLAASVLLALLFALVATRRSARPAQPLPRTAWTGALLHAAYGLLVALLVLYPAFNELLNENFEALPLSVTLAALPLVLSMGVAEALLVGYVRAVRAILAATGSHAEFARDMRRELTRTQLVFTATLAALTAVLAALTTAVLGAVDDLYMLLGLSYLVLGSAIFAAMVLNLMGRIAVVVATLGTAVAVLLVSTEQADYLVTDETAVIGHGLVAAALLVVHVALARRYAARAVSYW